MKYAKQNPPEYTRKSVSGWIFFSAGMMFKNMFILACPLMVSPNEQGSNGVGSLGLTVLPQMLHGKSFIMGQADFGVRYRI